MIERLQWLKIEPASVACDSSLGQELLLRHYGFVPESISPAPDMTLTESSVDLLFAALVKPHSSAFSASLEVWHRAMVPGAPLMLSCLGPDSFGELRESLDRLPDYVDMHDVGDQLLAAGFADPVMEMEKIELSYRNIDVLHRDLTGLEPELAQTGVESCVPGIVMGETLTVTIEVVYGHAWKPLSGPGRGEFRGIPLVTD